MKIKVVLVLSGGVDSTTLLYWLKDRQYEVKAICFNYGQKQSKELKLAKKSCDKLGVDCKVVNLKELGLILKSALTDKKQEVPEGDYKDAVMKQTVVPNRNMIMLSIAMGYAIAEKFNFVAYGAHSGDHTIYPDCRPIFVKRLGELAEVVDYKPIHILTPFLDIKKSEIIKIGKRLKVDYSLTWSCYKGGKRACGKCGTCVERLEAFKKNGLKDPIKYER